MSKDEALKLARAWIYDNVREGDMQGFNALVALEAADAEVAITLVDEGKYKRGDTVRCEYDGFVGTILAPYVTREGRKGWVVQMIDTKVVHVYGEDRLS